MSYATGEAALLTLVRTLDEFDVLNSSSGRWGILNDGKSNVFAVLKRGESAHGFISPTATQNDWLTVIQVWQRYDDNAYTNILATVDALVSKIDKYRFFNTGATGGIVDSNVRSVGETVEMWKPSGVLPVWLRQDIRIEWSEQQNITLEE